MKLPDVPDDDLFSLIKGRVFKCTIVNNGFGPTIVAMKEVKQ